MTGNVLVFDVGKTHIKLVVVDANDDIIQERQCENVVIDTPPYPHFDITGIWNWFIAGCVEITQSVDIEAVVTTTHGSVAALIDPDKPGDGLTLPVVDYEFRGVETCNDRYEPLRPAYSACFSPSLPGGLNLGRQLYWQQTQQNAAFAATRAILLYPQYWSWRMSGCLTSEVTSIGCHSDLWEPATQRFSTLATGQDWAKLFPAFVPAWQSPGFVSAAFAEATGLAMNCRVLPGLHDSNAGLLRHLRARETEAFTLVSTGTWTVSMSVGADLNRLDASRDMLANVDAYGRAVACARFMGGREYEEICRATGVDPSASINQTEVCAVIDHNYYALPDFSGGSGPFGGAAPRLKGQPVRSAAVAALYCALMIDYELELLDASGDVIVEGAFVRNRLLCKILAQLRATQNVYLSSSISDVVLGAALTARGAESRVTPKLMPCAPGAIPGLRRYRAQWRQYLPG